MATVSIFSFVSHVSPRKAPIVAQALFLSHQVSSVGYCGEVGPLLRHWSACVATQLDLTQLLEGGISFCPALFASLDVENAAAPEILPSRKRETTLGVRLASA